MICPFLVAVPLITNDIFVNNLNIFLALRRTNLSGVKHFENLA